MSYNDDEEEVYEDDEEEDDRELKVGARVQKDDDVAEPIGGVVEAHEPAVRPREREYWKFSEEEQDQMNDHWVVKWDDGSTERVTNPSLEDNELERKFRKAADEAGKKIQKLLAKASKAIDEAEEIAEKFGVPFSSSVSPLSQAYYPTTTNDLYPDLDRDFIDTVSGAYHSDYGEDGWQHSAVC